MRGICFLLLIVILISCHTKHGTEKDVQSVVVPDSTEQVELSEFENSSKHDSIIGLVRGNLTEWFEYQTHNNPYFAIDSFVKLEVKPLIKVSEAFDLTADFAKTYSRLLSYSPDSSSILDLFSNQIELKELSNGKYGGLYTILVRPYLFLPSKGAKYYLSINEGTDLFHDSFWASNSVLILVGTSTIPRDKDFLRYYKLWVLDLDKLSVATWRNVVPDRNYHVDFYVINEKMRGYEVWMDEE